MKSALGIALVLIGASMADSDRLWVPVLVTALGALILWKGEGNDRIRR